MITVFNKEKAKKSEADILITKVASGDTFDVFQWKRPENSNNYYKVRINGKEYLKKSKAKLIFDSFYYSNYVNGKNRIEVYALTQSGEEVKYGYFDFFSKKRKYTI